ncbi:MAG TPA: FlgD immunoglobulin-like domain containing protein [Candidatus Krumholzibacteria bacterium]|nr:FlgD immunoglobulin-like domain containing protein [Candidatus Krumholzibacteria bacterium]
MPKTMARVVGFACLLCFLFASLVQAADTLGHGYSHRYGNIQDDSGTGVAFDANGNVFLTGYFNLLVNFGGSDLVSAGGSDIFLAKFDANGNHLWSKRFGTGNSDISYTVALDMQGNPVIAGTYSGTMNMGGSDLISQGTDFFIAKFANADGAHIWSVRYGAAGNGESVAFPPTLAVDGSNNVWFDGQFSTTINLGGTDLVANGAADAFVAKYNSSGAYVWHKQYGSTLVDGARDIVADAAGNGYLTGIFFGTIDFGGGNTLTAVANADVFVLKLDTNGNHVWSKRCGGPGSETAHDIALAASQTQLVVSGQFDNSVDVGGGPMATNGSVDVFLAKYDVSGNFIWGRHYGGTTVDTPNAVAGAPDGAVALTGQFTGTVNFGNGSLSATPGSNDDFTIRVDNNGNTTGMRGWGDLSSSDFANSMAINAKGEIAWAGNMGAGLPIDLGGGSLTGAGGRDIVFARFGPDNETPRITSIKDVGNDQGRLVKVRFVKNVHDGNTLTAPTTGYEVYRRDIAPPSSILAAPRRGTAVDGWILVGQTPAHGDHSYTLEVSTIGDSTLALGDYNSSFFVRAATSSPLVFADSDPDSGSSVDNLAPGIPGMFAFTAGNLTWKDSTAKDFDYFSVYGSNVDSFAGATLVNYTTAVNMNVAASPYVYYYVTATDFSGNEGKPAKVNTLSGVGATPSSYVLSVSNYPNPFNPRTTVKYTVPARGEVTVAVYDAHGAHVATLFHGERAAGAYSTEWDGRGANGAVVSSGVYFARIEQSGAVRTKKMVLLK